MKFLQSDWKKAFSDSWIMFWIFACVWILRLAMLDNYPIPKPAIPDEFANFLGAQTFAEGKLSNKPIPKELHDSLFELYVLDEPTRMMKYQPAMAGFMAIGIKLFGNAYWGVVLLMSLALPAMYWAMRGWAGKVASALFAIYMILFFRAPNYWIDSYWGGGHILLAASLLLGSYSRIVYQKQYSTIWIFAIGGAIALLSRPYEGAVFIISLLILLFVKVLWKNEVSENKKIFKNSLLPIICIGGLFIAFQASYNKLVTGSYLKLPNALYIEQHDIVTSFWILGKNEKNSSDHYILKNSQNSELDKLGHQYMETFVAFPISTIKYFLGSDRIETILKFYADYFPKDGILYIINYALLFSFGFIVPIIIILFSFYKKTNIDLALLFLIQSIAVSLLTWHRIAHYFAVWFLVYSVIISIFISIILKKINIAWKAGLFFCFFCFLLIPDDDQTVFFSLNNYDNYVKLRENINNDLVSGGEKNIVFVDAGQESQTNKKGMDFLFVYNEPDIDKSKIIWAWDMSQEQNKKLIEAYPNRKLWYIEPYKEQKLMPYYEKYSQ